MAFTPGAELMSLETLHLKGSWGWNAGKRFLKLMKSVSQHLQISALPSFSQQICSMPWRSKCVNSTCPRLRYSAWKNYGGSALKENRPNQNDSHLDKRLSERSLSERITKPWSGPMTKSLIKIFRRKSLNYGWKKDKSYYKLTVDIVLNSQVWHYRSTRLKCIALFFYILDKWMPVMTRLLPAPDPVLYLVKCGCGKDKCRNNKCICRRAGLTCTDLGSCSNNETGKACDNV